MYRWQDPAPAPVVAIRERRMKHESREFYEVADDNQGEISLAPDQYRVTFYGPAVPLIPSMTIDGVEYVEAPETNKTSNCEGCAFNLSNRSKCLRAEKIAMEAFGADCTARHVIYIRKA